MSPSASLIRTVPGASDLTTSSRRIDASAAAAAPSAEFRSAIRCGGGGKPMAMAAMIPTWAAPAVSSALLRAASSGAIRRSSAIRMGCAPSHRRFRKLSRASGSVGSKVTSLPALAPLRSARPAGGVPAAISAMRQRRVTQALCSWRFTLWPTGLTTICVNQEALTTPGLSSHCRTADHVDAVRSSNSAYWRTTFRTTE